MELRRGAGLTAFIGLLATACATRPAGTPTAPSSRRPNIVFILTDDMALSDAAYMPRLKTQIGDRGLTFTNMFVTDSVCCPSRASILRGQYVRNHGVLDNARPIGSYRKFFELGHEASTVATWLHAAGYRTALIGKYLNQYPLPRDPAHIPPAWDHWQALTAPEDYYNYSVNEKGRIVPYGESAADYQTDVLAGKALEFITQRPPLEPQAFFLYLAPFAPHAAPIGADRHEALFPDARAPRTPSFNEQDVTDKPKWVRQTPPMTPELIEQTDDWFRKRLRTLQAVDEMVDRIVQALAARGELANTYLFFASDNGFQLGAHRLDHGKGDAYEESIRVPLVVRGPGVPAGRRLNHIVLNIDLAPTFAGLAGAAAPEFVDGRSLVPLLGASPPAAEAWRTDFMVEHFVKGDGEGLPEFAGLRTLQYKYVEYPNGERELYDLTQDPYELQSIHATADPRLLRGLADRLAFLKKCGGASCRE